MLQGKETIKPQAGIRGIIGKMQEKDQTILTLQKEVREGREGGVRERGRDKEKRRGEEGQGFLDAMITFCLLRAGASSRRQWRW